MIRNTVALKHMATPAMKNASDDSAIRASIKLTPHISVRSRLNNLFILIFLRVVNKNLLRF